MATFEQAVPHDATPAPGGRTCFDRQALPFVAALLRARNGLDVIFTVALAVWGRRLLFVFGFNAHS
jgi:hypothetical protein